MYRISLFLFGLIVSLGVVFSGYGATFLRGGDGRAFLRLDRESGDRLYIEGIPGSLLSCLVPVIRIDKTVYRGAVTNSRPETAADMLWIERGRRYGVPAKKGELGVSERLTALGKGRFLLRLIITNPAADGTDADVGLFYAPGEGLRERIDPDVPGGVVCRADSGARFTLIMHTGEKIRPLHREKLRGFLGALRDRFPASVRGMYSRVEIPAGGSRVVYILLTAGKGGSFPADFLSPDRSPDWKALSLDALSVWRGWLGNRAFRFKSDRVQRLYLDALYATRSALPQGAGTPDTVASQTRCYALLENGFHEDSGRILNGLTRFYTGKTAIPPGEMGGYVSLLLCQFIRSGKFSGSLVLAGQMLEKLAAIPTEDVPPALLPSAPLIAAGFADGALLMHYARQRSRQERYSILARRWVKLYQDALFTGEKGIAADTDLRMNGFAGRILVGIHEGLTGLTAASGLDPDTLGEARAVFAGGAFVSGYPLLGRQLLHEGIKTGAALLRSLGLAARYGGLPGDSVFPNGRIRAIREALVCLGRISRTVQNCLPYKNARYVLDQLLKKPEKERERYLLRLAAIFERLRRQTSQSVQEYALRLLALDTADRLRRMTVAMLANAFDLVPRFTTPGSFSFVKAPAAFRRGLRLTTENSGGFTAHAGRAGDVFNIAMNYGGNVSRDSFGGTRLVFRSRFRGVDFVLKHALVRRLRFPFRVSIRSRGGAYTVRLENRTKRSFDAVRTVLPDGFTHNAPLTPPGPGSAIEFRILPSETALEGEYPVMVLVKIGERWYNSRLRIRHAPQGVR